MTCETNPITDINKALRLYKQQAQAAEDARSLAELARQHLYTEVKSYTTIFDYMPEVVRLAFDEISITDKRRKRDNLKALQNQISKNFFDNEESITISKLAWFGLHTISFYAYFELHGRKYYLDIPIKKNISYSDFDEWNCGKFSFVREESAAHWKVLCSSYDMNEVKNYIMEYFNLTTNKEEKNDL